LIAAVGCHSRHERRSSSAPATSRAVAATPPSDASPSVSSLNHVVPPSPRAWWFALPPELNFDSLPVIEPAPCREGGARAFVAVPRERWKPMLEAAVRSWPEGTYPPNECMRSVRARCAPDIDGTSGAEVLVEVAYRVPLDGILETQHPLSPPCGSKDRGTQGVILSFTPPRESTGEWSFRGIVGFTSYVTGERGLELAIKGFVRLPNGWTGVRAHAAQPGFTLEHDFVIAYDLDFPDGPTWRTVGDHELRAPDVH